ncbi:tetratricopeptide repeat protein [Cytophagaceae bacterium ABcell3]|nr:tetratricopeptide repeat protein [Cytophagaceae bacterium ABcell3]
MRKSQIIIVVIALIVLVSVFRLPKLIVTSDESLVAETEEASYVDPSEMTESHKTSLSETEKEKISYLREQIKTVSDNEKKIIFADSLAAMYMNHLMFEDAAQILESVAVLSSSKDLMARAGKAYYDAFTVSMEAAKGKELNDKARTLFEKVLEAEPEDNEVKATYAMTFVTTENPMKGISILKEILKEEPTNETALHNMGLLSMQSGQYDKALERFKAIIKLNPNHPNAHFYIGMCYNSLGNQNQALEHLEMAKEINDDPAFIATVDHYINDIK